MFSPGLLAGSSGFFVEKRGSVLQEKVEKVLV